MVEKLPRWASLRPSLSVRFPLWTSSIRFRPIINLPKASGVANLACTYGAITTTYLLLSRDVPRSSFLLARRSNTLDAIQCTWHGRDEEISFSKLRSDCYMIRSVLRDRVLQFVADASRSAKYAKEMIGVETAALNWRSPAQGAMPGKAWRIFG